MSVVIEKELVSAKSVSIGFENIDSFELMQRVAKMLAASTIVPKEFQNNIPNCSIAINMAMRMKTDVMMTMQNLFVIHGRPSFSTKMLIALFNASGRYSSLRYKFVGKEGTDQFGCQVSAIELSTGELLEGSVITIDMAKKEGWYGKPGSKWQTTPSHMLRKRAAAWFINDYAPDISMGISTTEEEFDNVVEGEVINTAAPRRVGNLTKAAPILPPEQQIQEPVEV
jgi:hypothetical protein